MLLTLRHVRGPIGGAVACRGGAAVGRRPLLIIAHHISNLALKVSPQLLQGTRAVPAQQR